MKHGNFQRNVLPLIFLFSLFLFDLGCSKVRPPESPPPPVTTEKQGGIKKTMAASYYGRELAGKKTASGEQFQPNGLTAAHRSLAFGTKLRLTNNENGKTVEVRVNDRGPFVGGRDLDLSRGAATALGMKEDGVTTLSVEILPPSSS